VKYRQDSTALLFRKLPAPRTPWPPGSVYVTIAEAAQFLRCGRRNIERKLETGELPKHKDGRRTLIKRTDLLAYARKMRVK
jgi:excisionase family DNA binding protein